MNRLLLTAEPARLVGGIASEASVSFMADFNQHLLGRENKIEKKSAYH